MSDIQFEADVDNNPRYANRAVGHGAVGGPQISMSQSGGTSHIGMVNWLIRHGIIRGESGAKTLLIALIAINFIATGLILYFFVLR
ncbi:MAG: hypothetical protein PHG25_03960 [Candidatus Pacebacteria bacterium]|nr:hypothetical protein [Candidatus Paceibacterota bacterium]